MRGFKDLTRNILKHCASSATSTYSGGHASSHNYELFMYKSTSAILFGHKLLSHSIDCGVGYDSSISPNGPIVFRWYKNKMVDINCLALFMIRSKRNFKLENEKYFRISNSEELMDLDFMALNFLTAAILLWLCWYLCNFWCALPNFQRMNERCGLQITSCILFHAYMRDLWFFFVNMRRFEKNCRICKGK